jgi:hypothetical protein
VIAPDRRLVKRWRRRVRALVKTNPALARQRKGVRRWNRPMDATTLRWMVPLVAGAIAASQTIPPPILFGLGLLWTMSVVFNRAQQWAIAHSPEALWFHYQHPVTNAAVFAHQRGLLLRSSWWLAADWLVGLSAWAVAAGSPTLGLLAPVVAATQWAAALAVALWLVRRWPRVPYVWGVWACWMALIFGAQAGGTMFTSVLTFLEKACPAGWVIWGMRVAIAGNFAGWAVIVAVGAAAAWLIQHALAAACRDFSMERIFDYQPDADTAVLPAAPPEAGLDEIVMPGTPASRRPDANPVLVRQRLTAALHERPGAYLRSRTWLDRGLAGLLSRRSLVLADFFQPNSLLPWGLGWYIALGGLALALGLQLAGVSPIVAGGLSVFSLLFALPVLGGNWPGFSSVPFYQVQIGMNSCLPIGYWETLRLMLGTNAVRIVAASPLLLVAVRHGFASQPLGFAECVDYTMRLILALFAAQPVFILSCFSKTSNDTSSRWWFTLFLWGALLLGAAILIGCGIALFLLPQPGLAFLAGLGAVVYTHLVLIAYGWAYRCGVFDLVNTAPKTVG